MTYELMTKLENEQKTSASLREEIEELKKEIVKVIDLSIEVTNKKIQAQKELDFERQVSRKLIQELKQVRGLIEQIEKENK